MFPQKAVSSSMMPQGVEHEKAMIEQEVLTEREFIYDAARR
jgi:hypothetical protein